MSHHLRIDLRIQDIGEPVWAELCLPPNFYLSYPFLQTATWPSGAQGYYFTVWPEDGKLPLVAIPSFLLTEKNTYVFYNVPELLCGETILEELAGAMDAEPRARSAQLGADLRRSSAVSYPVLVCTAPVGYMCTVSGARTLSTSERRVAVGELVSGFEKFASKLGAESYAFLYIPEGVDPDLEDVLLETGYQRLVLNADCLLSIAWDDFDGYLASRSRNNRWHIRREIARLREHGIHISKEDVSGLRDELAPLQANVLRKYGHQVQEQLIMRSYSRMREYLGPFVRVFVARRGSETLGFCLFFEKDDALYFRVAGLDYSRLENAPCYFNLAFYEPIRDATERGLRSIHYGMGSLDAKLRRGCALRNLFGFFKFKDELPEVNELVALSDRARRNQFDLLREQYRRTKDRPSEAPSGVGR